MADSEVLPESEQVAFSLTFESSATSSSATGCHLLNDTGKQALHGQELCPLQLFRLSYFDQLCVCQKDMDICPGLPSSTNLASARQFKGRSMMCNPLGARFL